MTPASGDDLDRTGVAAGLGAYLLWGFVVLFWPLLGHVGSLEILANRVVWAFVLGVLVLAVLRVPWTWLRGVPWLRLAIASLLIGVNWLVYIWSVNSGHVAEASLGYFLNPLVNVAVGTVAFRERPGGPAMFGVMLAALGAAVVATGMLATVWISLTLALSFSMYGVAKRGVRLGAMQGLAVESLLLLPLAVAYLLATRADAFTSNPRTGILLVAGGAVTLAPLFLFAQAAQRLPFGVLGMLQYIAPTIMLTLGVFHFGQHVPREFWIGLGFVLVGAAVFLGSQWRRGRRRPAPELLSEPG